MIQNQHKNWAEQPHNSALKNSNFGIYLIWGWVRVCWIEGQLRGPKTCPVLTYLIKKIRSLDFHNSQMRCIHLGCSNQTYNNFFLFSLVNPLDVGVVNLNLRNFCSDAMEDMGLKSHQRMCWSKAWCSRSLSLCWIRYLQLRSLLLEWLPTAQSLCWSITAHSSAHKSRFYLPCDGAFSKKSGFFGKVSPQHLLSCWKQRGNLFQEK